MAPNASLLNLKVLDANGEGTDSDVIAAINRAIQLKSTYNIRVINLSMGRGVFESYKQDPLCQAVESAWKAGIVVVVAAGNDGRDNSVGQNGCGRSQRSCRRVASSKTVPYARPGQSGFDGDGLQNLPSIEYCRRHYNGRNLCELLRRVHSRCRIPGYRRCHFDELRVVRK